MSTPAPKAPPQVRLHVVVTDVGSRGAEVMIVADAEGHSYLRGAPSVDEAVDLLKPLIKRLLWGADQPSTPEEEPTMADPKDPPPPPRS